MVFWWLKSHTVRISMPVLGMVCVCMSAFAHWERAAISKGKHEVMQFAVKNTVFKAPVMQSQPHGWDPCLPRAVFASTSPAGFFNCKTATLVIKLRKM